MDPKTDIHVKLIGEDGNAFHILGKVMRALKDGGHKDLATEYHTQATQGNYEDLLRVTMEYVHVE